MINIKSRSRESNRSFRMNDLLAMDLALRSPKWMRSEPARPKVDARGSGRRHLG